MESYHALTAFQEVWWRTNGTFVSAVFFTNSWNFPYFDLLLSRVQSPVLRKPPKFRHRSNWLTPRLHMKQPILPISFLEKGFQPFSRHDVGNLDCLMCNLMAVTQIWTVPDFWQKLGVFLRSASRTDVSYFAAADSHALSARQNDSQMF